MKCAVRTVLTGALRPAVGTRTPGAGDFRAEVYSGPVLGKVFPHADEDVLVQNASWGVVRAIRTGGLVRGMDGKRGRPSYAADLSLRRQCEQVNGVRVPAAQRLQGFGSARCLWDRTIKSPAPTRFSVSSVFRGQRFSSGHPRISVE